MSHIERGRRLLLQGDGRSSRRIVALVLRANRVVSVGYNSYLKTHPWQSKLAKEVGQPHREYLHAEVAALLRAPRDADTLVVVRLGKQGDLRCAKPCPICALAAQRFGIKHIIHS